MCTDPTITAIYTGRNLGRGTFCVVKEVMEMRKVDNSCPSQYFALKQPRSDLSSGIKKKVYLELQNEIEILSGLDHKNIIQIQRHINVRTSCLVYLGMEKLPITLCRQIKLWKSQRSNAKMFQLRQQYPHKSDQWKEMIGVIQDIAHAMKYIHSQDIILRDLKPNNIGFNADGTLKLFDFGLAINLTNIPEKKIGVDQYLLEEGAGTLRYMCPEVACGRIYGKPCDVYSFALVAWEILTLEKPYAAMTPEILIEEVYKQHQRPKVVKKWPAELQNLLHRSWYNNPRYRPQFSEICELLVGLNDQNKRKHKKLNKLVRRMCRTNSIPVPH